jgi:hypothetical protein
MKYCLPSFVFFATTAIAGIAASDASWPQSASKRATSGESDIQYSTPWGDSFRPKAGYVPDEKTAAKIGEAILIPVYGKEVILEERPFKATLQGDVWTVKGTLHCSGCDGGTAVIRISKTTGQILFMAHYQ